MKASETLATLASQLEAKKEAKQNYPNRHSVALSKDGEKVWASLEKRFPGATDSKLIETAVTYFEAVLAEQDEKAAEKVAKEKEAAKNLKHNGKKPKDEIPAGNIPALA